MENNTTTPTPAPLAPLAVDGRTAARLLSVSSRTITAMTKTGDLPSFKARGRRLYSVRALEHFITKAQAQGGAK